MSDWQGFAEHGDPTEDGNCRWCGRKLRHEAVIADDSQSADPTALRSRAGDPQRAALVPSLRPSRAA